MKTIRILDLYQNPDLVDVDALGSLPNLVDLDIRGTSIDMDRLKGLLPELTILIE